MVFFPIQNNRPGQILVQNLWVTRWLKPQQSCKRVSKSFIFQFLICTYLTLKGPNTSTTKPMCFLLCHFSERCCVLKWFVLKKKRVSNTGSLLSEQTHVHSTSKTFCLYSAFCVNIQNCLFHFLFPRKKVKQTRFGSREHDECFRELF